MKFCECGCGAAVPLVTRSNARKGHVKGLPVRFIKGHWARTGAHSGENHPAWKGGRTHNSQGYVTVLMPEHPRSSEGYVFEHVVIAEHALGRPLPPKVEVHHFNEQRSDNRNQNLVICEDHAYHMLLHQRSRAVAAGHPASWRKCKHCKRFDAPENLTGTKTDYHRSCNSEKGKLRYATLKEAR